MDFEVSGTCCIWAALICLTLPLQWVLAAVAAAVIHEACHFLAVFLAGGTVRRLRIGIRGMVMDAAHLSVPGQLLCILAGPAGSLLLILTGRFLPELSICGFVQGIYNLLPLYPLDGGRALRCIAERLFQPATAERICSGMEWGVILGLLLLAIWASMVKRLGAAPVVFWVFLVSGPCFRKISCKECDPGVQ